MDNSGAIDKVEMVKVMEAIYSMVDGNIKVRKPILNSTHLKLERLLRSPVRIELKKASSCTVGGTEGRDRRESLQACGAAFQDD